METEKTLLKLVNPQIEFQFGEKQYMVRKANLEKAVLYQQKIKELSGDPAGDQKIVAFAIYLVLHDVEPEITEDKVLNETPGDIDPIEILTFLGFINPQKMEIAKGLQNRVMESLTTLASSGSSSRKQDGPQEKSAS